MSRGWLAVAVAGALLAGCSRIDVGAQRYVCVHDGGLEEQQCPGGWRCALDGFCVDPAVGADLRCELSADCTGGWHCSLEQRCVDPAIGKPLLCAVDADCTAGWKCTLEARCADPAVGKALPCATSADCTAGWKCTQESTCADPAVGKDLPCATSTDCTGGWHCGALSRCYDRADAGAVLCRRDAGVDDCAPQWRCGLDGRCQDTRAAAAYACTDDRDCEQGWRCPPEGRCVDPRADALRPTGDGGLRVVELEQLFPPNPTAVATGQVASIDVCGEAWTLRGSTSAGDAGWVRLIRPQRDVGLPVHGNGCDAEPTGTWHGFAWRRPSPGSVVDLADWTGPQSSTFALLEDGGLLRWDTDMLDGGEQRSALTLPFVARRLRWSGAAAGRLLAFDDAQVAAVEVDGGVTLFPPLPSPVQDVAELYGPALTAGPLLVVATEEKVLLFLDGGWNADWLAPDSFGLLDDTFALVPAGPGGVGMGYLRRPADGGLQGGVLAFNGGNGSRPLPRLSYDCAQSEAAELVAARLGTATTVRARIACVDALGLPTQVDETDGGTGHVVRGLPAGYVTALKGFSSADSVAWATPSGAVAAFGGRDVEPVDMDDLSTLALVPSATFGNSTVPVVTVQDGVEGQGSACRAVSGLGMVCAPTGLPVAAVARARPQFVLADFEFAEDVLPKLAVVRLDATSRLDRAHIIALRLSDFGPPYTLAAAPLPDGGQLVVASSSDTLLFAQTGGGRRPSELLTTTDFLQLPELTYATVPQSRASITSSVLLPRADAGVQRFAEAYVVAAGRVYRVLADNPVVWRADEVLPVTAEAISVWSDGPRVRVSFRDGTIYSLPSRLPVAPPLIAGASTVVDLADACGQSFALSPKGLFQLVSDGAPQGQWVRVGLPQVPESELAEGKLFADAQGLLLFLPHGRVLRVDGYPCAP